jgi:hypothetical protein
VLDFAGAALAAVFVLSDATHTAVNAAYAAASLVPLPTSQLRRQIAQAQSEERALIDEWRVAGNREALLLGLQVMLRDDRYHDGMKQPETKLLLVVFMFSSASI